MSVDERRGILVRAAIEVAAESGIAAVTTRSVCNRANAHLSAFHYCFSSKDDLLRLMAERVLRSIDEGFPVEEVTSLSELVATARQLLIDNFEYLRVLYELVGFGHESGNADGGTAWYFNRYFGILEERLEQFAERDGFSWSPDARSAATIIIYQLSGMGIAWAIGQRANPGADDDASVDAFVALIETMQVPATE